MEIIEISSKKISPRILSQAAKVIKRGGTVVYPTDTAYALGGIFNRRAAAEKILKIKGRKDEKFTLIAADLAQVKKFFKLNPTQKKLAKKYWPGPLSIVVSSRFAVRVPASLPARQLAEAAAYPLIATSANLTGEKTPYASLEIFKQFKTKKNQPDLVLAAGVLPKRKTSTVVEVSGGEIKVLRAGAVRLADIIMSKNQEIKKAIHLIAI